ncbi:putative Interferon-induced double-stranded RNA-activated protein, partial [Naja naja]
GELDSREQHKAPKLSLIPPSVPEFKSSNPINYVFCLNEYASKNKMRVDYILISKTGVQHNPVFSYACLIDNEEFGVGSGNKVKAAKNEAAKLAYEKLTRSSTIGAEECTNSSSDSFDVTFRNSQGQCSMDRGASGTKESPLAARFANQCTRTSKFTKNER